MSSYQILTLENPGLEDDVVASIGNMVRAVYSMENYISFLLNVEEINQCSEYSNSQQGFLQNLVDIDGLEGEKFSISYSNDTVDKGSATLYQIQNREFIEIDHIEDSEATKIDNKYAKTNSSRFNSWNIEEDYGSKGIPTKLYMKDKYGFSPVFYWDL